MINQVNIKTTSIDDVTEITSPEWNGKIFTVPRNSYQKFETSNLVPKTATIYILASNKYSNPKEVNSIYIGHTESVDTRIESHAINKDFWSTAFIFTSKDDWMNIAFTKNIEHRFIELTKLANRYTVTNQNNGGNTHLGVDDSRKLDEFTIKLKEVLKIARIDFFELNMNGVFTKEFKVCGERKTCKLHITSINTEEETVKIIAGSKIPFWFIKDYPIDTIDGISIQQETVEFTKEFITKYKDETLVRIFEKLSLGDSISQNGLKLNGFIRRHEKI